MGICLHRDGLERPGERCRFFMEVSGMIADLIHGHWVVLCLILSDVDVLEVYKMYDNASLAKKQLCFSVLEVSLTLRLSHIFSI